MSDKRSFSDAFAPRKPQGKTGFGPAKETLAKPGMPKPNLGNPSAKQPVTDAFKPVPKPVKAPPPKAASARDVFASKSQTNAPKTKPGMQRPPAPPKQSPTRHEAALKPVQQGGAKLPPLVRPTEPPPPKQPAMMRADPAPKSRNLFGRSGGETAPKQRALTPPPKQPGGKMPAMAFATAGAALPKPRGGAGYNPFDRRRFVVSPASPARAPAAASAPSAPDPFFDLPPPLAERSTPTPEPRRTPFHVVPSAAAVDAVSQPKAAKSGAAARSSSLVLVSGAGAVAAAAADAPEAPPAEKPAEAAPAAATAPPPAAPAAEQVGRGGGGRGRGGAGSGGSTGAPRQARAVAHRGFNQDDMFGVLFGIAVIAFLLMWFMRGKSDEAIEDGTLFAAQSAPVQRLAVSPTPPLPPPLPPVDPFGDKPVDLRPQGPIPEAATAPPEVAEVTPTPATPAPAAPPPVSAKPAPAIAESSLPLAERKMHAWFCTASSRLTKAARTELNGELDKFAQVFAGKELVVRGYADTRGSTEYNSALSGSRASVVADFLRTKGLTVTDSTGVGELEGLDDNQNCANQRRVDVWVKGGPAEAPSRACAPEPDVESLVCG